MESRASLSSVLSTQAGSKEGTIVCQMGMHKRTQKKKLDSQASKSSPKRTGNVQISLQYNEKPLGIVRRENITE